MEPYRPSLTRRAFLRFLAALGWGSPALLAGCDGNQEPAPLAVPVGTVPEPAFRFPARAKLVLERAVGRLLPSDDGPGAAEAHVLGYLEVALGGPPWIAAREGILAWVGALDRIAIRDWGAPGYAETTDESADRILEFVQSGSADEGPLDGRVFVHDLLLMSLEGFLGDPTHGGNAGCAGWRFIGWSPGEPRPGHCGHGG